MANRRTGEQANRRTGEQANTARKNFIILCDDAVIGSPQEYNARSFAKLFHELGYDSHIIGFGHQSEEDKNWLEDGKISWRIFGAKVRGNPVKRRITRYFKQKNILNSCELFRNAEIVLWLSCAYRTEFITLKKLQKKFGFKIICYMCEWFDTRRYFDETKTVKDFFDRIFKYMAEDYARRRVIVKNGHVFIVSKKLEEYYKNKNCHVLKIPNINEAQDAYAPINSEKDILILGYFGTPEKHNHKDLFNNVVKGLALLNDDEKKHVKFHVYGPLLEDFESEYDIDKNTLAAVKDVLIVHEKINMNNKEKKNDKTKEFQSCDFTVLLREKTYSLECALPSKMTASLIYGVPMICNLTSNMGEYLQDNFNAIISPSKEPADFANCVRKALKLTPEEKRIFKINAYESGKKYFDWRNYIEPVKNFISEM